MSTDLDFEELGHELGKQTAQVMNAFIFVVQVLKAQPGFDVGFFDQYIKNISAKLGDDEELTKLILDRVLS